MSNITVSLAELRRGIPVWGHIQTAYICGEPGTAKSSLLWMVAADLGDDYEPVYLDAPSLDQGDLTMMIPDVAERKLVQCLTDLIKIGNGKKKIIMIDEFGKCGRMLKKIFTRLILERTVGSTKLEEGSIVFCTSNNVTDGVGDAIEGHEGNRVTFWNLRKPTVMEYIRDFASQNGISTVTMAFCAMNESIGGSYMDSSQTCHPANFNPRTNNRTFLSYRSLTKADLAYVQNRHILGENMTFAGLVGTIGQAGAEALASFIALEKELVSTKAVLANPDGVPVPSKLAALYMMMFNAVEALETQDDLSLFMRFVGRANSSELESVFFTMLVGNKKTVRMARNNATITKWITENHQLLV